MPCKLTVAQVGNIVVNIIRAVETNNRIKANSTFKDLKIQPKAKETYFPLIDNTLHYHGCGIRNLNSTSFRKAKSVQEIIDMITEDLGLQ